MTDIVSLRQQFGISATEYMTTLPWWEVELLLGGDGPSGDAPEGGSRLSAFSDAPDLGL